MLRVMVTMEKMFCLIFYYTELEFIGQPNTTDSIGKNDRQANYHINNGSGGNVGKLL